MTALGKIEGVEKIMKERMERTCQWIKENKKLLVALGISIPALTALVLFSKDQEEVSKLLDKIQDELKNSKLYSSKWFESATDEELAEEREKVRKAFCSSGSDFSVADTLQRLLFRFDQEMSKRAWGDEIPHGPSYHREHGYYLPNDD